MEKRIDTKESRTAEIACLSRAMSFYEKNICLKGEDYIAPLILPPFFRAVVKSGLFRMILKKSIFRYGIYEYFIARTKYIDDIFKKLSHDFKQILIFGAGFDSRTIRFYDNLKDSTIYELDSPITQAAKINQFKKLNIDFPPILKFIPIDFEKETLNQKLDQAGFHKDKTSLFLLEGLTMYLDTKSIDNTFSIIKEYSGKDSLIVFDFIYSSVLRGEDECYGGNEIFKSTEKAGEKWVFGIEKGQINRFLNKYEFELVDESNPLKLEERFFKYKKGKNIGKINGAHCIITARKK